jgi:hypothetical protein
MATNPSQRQRYRAELFRRNARHTRSEKTRDMYLRLAATEDALAKAAEQEEGSEQIATACATDATAVSK